MPAGQRLSALHAQSAGAPSPRGLQHRYRAAADDFGWDLGLTGIGMPVTNGGGTALEPAHRPTPADLRLERRPVTGSLLSYAQRADRSARPGRRGAQHRQCPDCGRNGRWLGPVGTGQRACTGKNVASNQRMQVRGGTDVWRTPFQRVYAGARHPDRHGPHP
jgi:hypothetical protein